MDSEFYLFSLSGRLYPFRSFNPQVLALIPAPASSLAADLVSSPEQSLLLLHLSHEIA